MSVTTLDAWIQENIKPFLNGVEEAQTNLIEEFQYLSDWSEKYQYLIDLGHDLDSYPEELCRERFQLSGCQSQLWFFKTHWHEEFYFLATSDSMIVKGLIALISRIYNGRSLQDIMDTKARFIDELNLDRHLSANRVNGLYILLQNIYRSVQGLYKKGKL